MRSLLIAFAITGIATAAAAQEVYKYTTPGGGTVYTDNPAAVNKGAQKVDLPPTAPSSPVAPSSGLSDADRTLAEQADRRAAELNRAAADIVAAHESLRAAEANRAAGAEPIEGDRQGRRFQPEYWERQRSLEQDVVSSKARLDDALARRNALR
jgi:hypothetical protein